MNTHTAFFATTMSSAKVCRLCRAVVACNRAVQLFSQAGLVQQWPERITALLDVPVVRDDGASPSCVTTAGTA